MPPETAGICLQEKPQSRALDVCAAVTELGTAPRALDRPPPEGHAEVFKSEGSSRISGLSWADGFVELEDGARDITPGDPVRYLPFTGFGL